ncbi:uncharacterized protein [Physcomitrium patens]|uniref:uncharacterized protein n=1 Tax=Physcomitrium patens TaxID=3218 RepID=UPI000D171AC3|nr:uncharacterized protein LOC112275940 [Physcomitrium patens]|eukprot:XP_024362516.1 uncharacterized protein LOC112275940 [Physcomitrella patens]
MVDYYVLSLASIDRLNGLVGGVWLELNKSLCKHLSQELQEHKKFLTRNSVKLRFRRDGSSKQRVAMRKLYAVIKQAEILVQQCCGRDKSVDPTWPHWLKRALTVREIKEDVFDIILHLRWWTAILEIIIISSTDKSLPRMGNEIGSQSGSYSEEESFILGALKFADEKFERDRGLIKKDLKDGAKKDRDHLIIKLKDFRESFSSEPETHGRNLYLISAQLLYLLSDIEAQTQTVDRDSDLNRFKILRNVGHGGSGVVSEVEWCEYVCALKQFPAATSTADRRESESLRRFHHPHIVKFFHDWEEFQHSYILMEAMPTDLEKHMANMKSRKSGPKRKHLNSLESPFSVPVAIDIMLQLVRGLCHMHEQDVIHRDIKLRNVLVRQVREDEVSELASLGYLHVKLGDFGLVREEIKSSYEGKISLKAGTSHYRAPELSDEEYVNGPKKYPKKADVWSFSIMAAEVLRGEEAFPGIASLGGLVGQLEAGLRPILPVDCPGYLKSCLEKCWRFDYKDRPRFSEVWKMLRLAELQSLGIVDSIPMEDPQPPERIPSNGSPGFSIQPGDVRQEIAKQSMEWTKLLRYVLKLLKLKFRFAKEEVPEGLSIHSQSFHQAPFDGLVNRVWPEASALDWELDVLFFEGNVGSRSQLSCRDTWLQRNQPNVFWPQEWLPKDVKRNIRVSVLDYTISWETNGLKELIEDMKDYWLFSDTSNENRNWQRPIVLVGHSLGCAVIQALVVNLAETAEKHQDSEDETEKRKAEISRAFLNSLAGFFFYAPPHTGLVRDYEIRKHVWGGLINSRQVLKNLYTGPPWLNEPFGCFLEFIKAKNISRSRQIRCTELNEGRYMQNQKMVVQDSKVPIDGFQCEIISDSNHIDISKPVDRNHVTYQKLVEFLMEIELSEKSEG